MVSGSIAAALQQAVRHHKAGRLQEAERLYRQVLKAQPGNPHALNFLGLLAKQAGHLDSAVALIGRAVAASPGYAEAHVNLGSALRDQGKTEAAIAAFRQALAIRPDYPDAAFNLANALQERGEIEEAIGLYRRVLAGRPDYSGAHNNLAAALLKRHRPADALEAADAVLRREPQNVRAVAHKALALQELGRSAEAAYLVDLDRLVDQSFPPVPAAFADLAALNAALIDTIRTHPTLTATWNPAKRAARGGSVTADMLADPSPTIRTFEAMLRGAIERFTAQLPDDPGHPFLCRKPQRYSLILWGNILEEEGHQAAHIHNLGWLSGVYYAQVPESVGPDDPERAGWIEFGRPGYGLPCLAAPQTRAIKPEDGMLLLFPSYFWHRTIPFRSASERISLAFDLHAA